MVRICVTPKEKGKKKRAKKEHLFETISDFHIKSPLPWENKKQVPETILKVPNSETPELLSHSPITGFLLVSTVFFSSLVFGVHQVNFWTFVLQLQFLEVYFFGKMEVLCIHSAAVARNIRLPEENIFNKSVVWEFFFVGIHLHVCKHTGKIPTNINYIFLLFLYHHSMLSGSRGEMHWSLAILMHI